MLQHVNIALPHTATPHNDLLNLAVEHKVISQELSYLGVGLVFRNYLRMRKVTPYLGARFVALISMPSRSDSITDFFFGLPYGGEFFLVPQFGIGVEAQANLVKSDEKSSRFGNPGGINVNTAAAFVANVYF